MSALTVPMNPIERSHVVFQFPTASGVSNIWVLIRPFVEQALDFARGEVDANTLLARIEKGEVQLWIVWDEGRKIPLGVATTVVLEYDKLCALRIITMAGKGFSEWGQELHELLVQFAREQGCSRLEATGRRGLGKLLDRFDFKAQYTTFLKEV